MSGAAAGKDLHFERRGATGWLTFNRPHARNAMTFDIDMYEGLHERCEEVDADPELRALVLLVALIGVARTKELMFTARSVGAEEALAAGLATEVPAQGVEERVVDLCEALASHAPITLKVTKEALRRLRTHSLPDGDDLLVEAYGSQDFHDAVRAFTEKRKPVWQGS